MQPGRTRIKEKMSKKVNEKSQDENIQAEGGAVKRRKFTLKDTVINFICGIAVGAGAILPGISGGVLCVVFNVYRPLMELFAHPCRAVRKHLPIYIPLGIGWAVGFFVFARFIEMFFSLSEICTIWLFVGLIAGTFPSLWKEAGEKGRSAGSYVSLGICFTTLLSVLLFVRFSPGYHVVANTFWYAFAGVLWGLSIVIPGMTSSSILMSLDIYRDLNAGIADFSLPVILPWVAAMIVTAVLLAKFVNHMFDRHYSLAFHGVVGIVIASTVAMVDFSFTGISEILIAAAACIIGFLAAFFTEKIVPKKETEA